MEDSNADYCFSRIMIIYFVSIPVAIWFFGLNSLVFNYHQPSQPVGVGCSLMIQPNYYILGSIEMEQSSKAEQGAIIYGFTKEPHLDIEDTWSDAHYASFQADIYKNWIYFLNKGSEISVSYSVPGSSSLVLTIIQELEDSVLGAPHYIQLLNSLWWSDRSLSRNIIYGNGVIQQNIPESGWYRISMGSLNSNVEEVQLNITAKAVMYNTSEAHHICMLARGHCSIPIIFGEENYVVLTTPHLKQDTSVGEWDISMRYEPRWSVLFGGVAVIAVFMLTIIYLIRKGMSLCE